LLLCAGAYAISYKNTPTYVTGCVPETTIPVNVEIPSYSIQAAVQLCCYYIDGDELYGCERRTRYIAGGVPMFSTIDAQITFADMPHTAVEFLVILHGLMDQIKHAMFHSSSTLNELYACTISSGSNCDRNSIPPASRPYQPFDEPTCLEDDDDDGRMNEDDDTFEYRCRDPDKTIVVPSRFKTVIPQYASLRGLTPFVDFDPQPAFMTNWTQSQLDFFIYSNKRMHNQRTFKQNRHLPAADMLFVETALNYPSLARHTNITQLQTMMEDIKARTRPFNYEHRRPLVSIKVESNMVEIRYEDVARFMKRVMEYIDHPGMERTVSCLERFYFNDSKPIGSEAIEEIYSLINILDRFSAAVDDDDSDDHPFSYVERCDKGVDKMIRTRAYDEYTVDIKGLRVCHPYQIDPMCETPRGSNHAIGDESSCVRNIYNHLQSTSNMLMLKMQNIVQSIHTRIGAITEVLRMAKENNPSMFVFPSDTACFTLNGILANFFAGKLNQTLL
jgi:hypothetical protein